MCCRAISVLGLLTLCLGCVNGGLSGSEETPAAFNVAGAPTVEFSVPDMMCEVGCAAKVREILSEQPGTREVLVDFEAKTATVAIEEGAFDAGAAVAALVDHAFEHSELKTNAAQ